jgi:hypothetical protein
MTPFTTANPFTRILGGPLMHDSSRTMSTRSPVLAILGSIVAMAALAVAFAFTIASGGSEPLVTGSVLFAFGLGWGLMGFLSTRYSAQPQRWTAAPAAVLGSIGLGLIVFQPGPALMDFLGWVWPLAIAGLATWMVIQVRASLRGRGRWIVVPVIATLFAFSIGGALTAVGAATAVAQAGTGKMIDVGGHRLYIEAGSQDGIALATDLQTLLERAGVPGPYILVAHSSGGPYVRVFAAQYPDEVAGMVLLDAQPSDAFTVLPQYPGVYSMFETISTLSPSLARIGLLAPLLGLPADESTAAIVRGARDEVRALRTALQQSAALTSLGDRPLIVVTAAAQADPGWVAAQDALPRLSTASIHRVMASATHNSLISGADVGASSRAILDVLAAVRAATAAR